MTPWALPLVPALLGSLLWTVGRRVPPHGRVAPRALLATGAAAGLTGVIGLALWAAVDAPAVRLEWGGALVLSLKVVPTVGVAAVLIPSVALPVLVWAAAHEAERGLARLVGLLVLFVGAMELLVLASDLLTLAIGWELVSALSWALIGHRWRDREATSAASYAFNATRLGGLGLWVAAAAAWAVTGKLDFAALGEVARSPWGDAMAAGVLFAAAAKSAQGPFAPWLFRAMEGPSSVSALLHSSTMVAAGAWLLVRLYEPLGAVSWFGPAALGIGLATALAGGVVAAVQPHAKRLLAASTSAQFGLVFSAVGAGFAGAGLVHLVTHAAFKALLFLVAGMAIHAAGTPQLRQMRLGGRSPTVATASAIGALSLAAVPPLGGAWSKEQIVAATGHVAPWLAWVAIAAGALSAWYALRFQRLAYGRGPRRDPLATPSAERVPVWVLAALSLGLGLLWLPAVRDVAAAAVAAPLPEGRPWELMASAGTVLLAGAGALVADRRERLEPAFASSRLRRHLADWLGLPSALGRLVVAPVRRLALACARFDDRVVDAGVRGAVTVARSGSSFGARLLEGHADRALEWLVRAGLRAAAAARRADERRVDAAVDGAARWIGGAGANIRRVQTGAVPTYYSMLTGGLLILLIVLATWR